MILIPSKADERFSAYLLAPVDAATDDLLLRTRKLLLMSWHEL
jgi:hypothetical protein